MPHLGPTELLIIFLIVLVLFGAGRVGKLGGELGTAIREFRRGVNDGNTKQPTPEKPDDTTTTNTKDSPQ
jgi:sec-independent protein translocase protein TatA